MTGVDRVLVLDDEEHFADMLKNVLEQNFYAVDAATSPMDALKMIEHNGYKLVVSDYKMPVMDGADFLVKAREFDPDLPVILVSGLMNTRDLLKVANMGVTLVFEKPINGDVFLKSVRRFAKPMSAEIFSRFNKGGDVDESNSVDALLRTYPFPLQYVSDRSVRMVHFLQKIYDDGLEQSHVFIKSPAGCEVELLLRETTRWLHKKPRDLVILRADQPGNGKTLELLESIPMRDNLSCCVGIVGYERASMEQQDTLVDYLREAPEEIIFYHFINEKLLEDAPERIQSELMELIRESLAVMPALRDRLSDMVGYINQFLPKLAQCEGKPGCGTLDASAISALLSCGWTGNFAQLIDVLRRSVLLCPESRPIQFADLKLAMDRAGLRAIDGNLSLEESLMQAQRKILKQRMPEYGNNLGELMHAAKAKASLYQNVHRVDDLPLLFPELLEATPVSI